MTNTSKVLQSSNETIRILQRTIGFAIVAGSVGSALFTFLNRRIILDYSVMEAIRHYNVWFTSTWIPIGIYTALAKHKIARVVQVYAFFLVACVSAANLNALE